jgi:hypothetical protein
MGPARLPPPEPRTTKGYLRRGPLPQVLRHGPDKPLARSDRAAGWGRDHSEGASGGPVSRPVVRPRLPFYGLGRGAPACSLLTRASSLTAAR